MSEKTVRVVIDGGNKYGEVAVVPASVKYRGTTTHGSGSANVERYDVVIAGHQLHGEWNGNAFRDTVVHITSSHPLADAIRIIGRGQDSKKAWLSMKDRKAPSGFRPEEWRDEVRRAYLDWQGAMQEGKGNSVVCEILGGTDRD